MKTLRCNICRGPVICLDALEVRTRHRCVRCIADPPRVVPLRPATHVAPAMAGSRQRERNPTGYSRPFRAIEPARPVHLLGKTGHVSSRAIYRKSSFTFFGVPFITVKEDDE